MNSKRCSGDDSTYDCGYNSDASNGAVLSKSCICDRDSCVCNDYGNCNMNMAISVVIIMKVEIMKKYQMLPVKKKSISLFTLQIVHVWVFLMVKSQMVTTSLQLERMFAKSVNV